MGTQSLERFGIAVFESDLGLIQSKADLVLHGGWKLLQVRFARTDPFDRLQHLFRHIKL